MADDAPSLFRTAAGLVAAHPEREKLEREAMAIDDLAERHGFVLVRLWPELCAELRGVQSNDDPVDAIHNQVIGYLKGKASAKQDEVANAPNPIDLETDIDTLKDAAAVLEEEVTNGK